MQISNCKKYHRDIRKTRKYILFMLFGEIYAWVRLFWATSSEQVLPEQLPPARFGKLQPP